MDALPSHLDGEDLGLVSDVHGLFAFLRDQEVGELPQPLDAGLVEQLKIGQPQTPSDSTVANDRPATPAGPASTTGTDGDRQSLAAIVGDAEAGKIIGAIAASSAAPSPAKEQPTSGDNGPLAGVLAAVATKINEVIEYLGTRQGSGLPEESQDDGVTALLENIINHTQRLNWIKGTGGISVQNSAAGIAIGLSERPAEDGGILDETHFEAIIGASTLVSPNLWSYAFQEAEETAIGPGGLTVKAGGRTGTAYNKSEDINTASVLGIGVDPAHLDTADYLFALGPCPVGTPRTITVGYVMVAGVATPSYRFEYEGSPDGECL